MLDDPWVLADTLREIRGGPRAAAPPSWWPPSAPAGLGPAAGPAHRRCADGVAAVRRVAALSRVAVLRRLVAPPPGSRSALAAGLALALVVRRSSATHRTAWRARTSLRRGGRRRSCCSAAWPWRSPSAARRSTTTPRPATSACCSGAGASRPGPGRRRRRRPGRRPGVALVAAWAVVLQVGSARARAWDSTAPSPSTRWPWPWGCCWRCSPAPPPARWSGRWRPGSSAAAVYVARPGGGQPQGGGRPGAHRHRRRRRAACSTTSPRAPSPRR